VPHEYGLEASQKLRIGSKIAAELLAKLLMDLASMQVRVCAVLCRAGLGWAGLGWAVRWGAERRCWVA